MIQVCAQCGTRWNVRDRERVWCPRCNGTLLAPASAPPVQVGRPVGAQPAGARKPSGYRWIAVRPGPPPPARRAHRSPGPTPRYQSVPRWGLHEQFVTVSSSDSTRKNSSAAAVRTALTVTALVLALAAAAHVLRYVLMLINRTTLLPPFIAVGAVVIGALTSLAAIIAVMVAAVLSTSWLIGRRAAAFANHGQDDPRSESMLWLGCLVPVMNWFFAPLFALELAQAEGCRSRQNRPIAMWAAAWIIATLICAWATWTGLRATELQAVADNTVTMIIGYLAGLAVIVLIWRVFEGFDRHPVDRPLHRWVVMPAQPVGDEAASASPGDVDVVSSAADTGGAEEPVKSRDREPVA